EILAGFSSALLLLGIAALMVIQSIERLINPETIEYRAAIGVAVIGLVVNVISALILGQAHDHDDHHGHGHDQHAHDHHQDLNLKAAYVHVIADAATSILAIIALLGGWFYGLGWLDPLMGIAGAVLIGFWAKNLIAQTGRVLLDREMDHPVVDEIREVIETGPEAGDTRITDLHVWRVGKRAYACALTVLTHDTGLTAQQLRERLAVHEEIVHATIEIVLCPDVAAVAEPAR
ncbi:MAG: cation diffusion facilitator family transporter, partial [Gammaproteobacteria bacterium]|nr:cation diffusion facilitator family transporter [Gammaproteobacteria bacterium]